MKIFFLNDATDIFAHEGPRLEFGELHLLAVYLAEVSIVEASEVFTGFDIWNWIVAP